VQAKRWRRLVVRAGVGVYRAFERFVWNPFEVLTVFVRRLTIPLVDEDTWDKNLVVVCLPFAMLLLGVFRSRCCCLESRCFRSALRTPFSS
jgi:hypothetical protein